MTFLAALRENPAYADYSDDEIAEGIRTFKPEYSKYSAEEIKAVISQPGSRAFLPEIIGETPEATLGDRTADLGIDAAKSVVGAGNTLAGMAGLATGGLATKGLRALGWNPDATDQFLSDRYSPERKAEEAEVRRAKGFTGTVKALVTNPAALAGEVVQSAPMMLGAMGAAKIVAARAYKSAEAAALARGMAPAEAAKVATGAAKKAATLAAAAAEGAQAGGLTFDELDRQGADLGRNYVASLGTFLTTAAIGVGAGKLGLGDVEAGIGASGSVPVRALKGAAQEGPEETTQSATEQGWKNVGLQRPIGEGVPEAAGAGLALGAVAGGGFGALNRGPAEPQADPAAAPVEPVEPAAPEQKPVTDIINDAAGVRQPPSKAEHKKRQQDIEVALNEIVGRTVDENQVERDLTAAEYFERLAAKPEPKQEIAGLLPHLPPDMPSMVVFPDGTSIPKADLDARWAELSTGERARLLGYDGGPSEGAENAAIVEKATRPAIPIQKAIEWATGIKKPPTKSERTKRLSDVTAAIKEPDRRVPGEGQVERVRDMGEYFANFPIIDNGGAIIVQGKPEEIRAALAAKGVKPKGIINTKIGGLTFGKSQAGEVRAALADHGTAPGEPQPAQTVTGEPQANTIPTNKEPANGLQEEKAAPQVAAQPPTGAEQANGDSSQNSSVVDRSRNPRTLATKPDGDEIAKQRDVVNNIRLSTIGRPENILARAWSKYESQPTRENLAWLIAVDERINKRKLPDEFSSREAGNRFLEKNGLAGTHEIFLAKNGKYTAIHRRGQADETAAGLIGAGWPAMRRAGISATYTDSYADARERNQWLMDSEGDRPGMTGGKVGQLSEAGIVLGKAAEQPTTGAPPAAEPPKADIKALAEPPKADIKALAEPPKADIKASAEPPKADIKASAEPPKAGAEPAPENVGAAPGQNSSYPLGKTEREISEKWRQIEHGKREPSEAEARLIESVSKARESGAKYYAAAADFVAEDLGDFWPENIETGVDGGARKSEVVSAWKYLDSQGYKREIAAAKERLNLKVGQKIGSIIPNTGKTLVGAYVESVSGDEYVIRANLGGRDTRTTMDALSLERAMKRAEQKAARKDQPATKTGAPEKAETSKEPDQDPAKAPDQNQDDEAAAVAILDRAKVTGKERLDILRDFREGRHSLKDIESAYPEKATETADKADSIKQPSTTQPAEAANTAQEVGSRGKFWRANSDAMNDAERELRSLSHKEMQEGDVLLGNGRYVPFDDAVRLAREGIESGAFMAAPAQIYFNLDVVMRDVDRVLKAATEQSAGQSKHESENGRRETSERQESARIEDFGEVLHGARKHQAAYRDRLAEAKSVDIAAEPLSKSWPEPDYQKLLDEGTDPWTVAFVRAARDEIPTKPQKRWKVTGWAANVKMLRGLADDMLTGKISKDRVQALLNTDEHARLREALGGRIDLYLVAGHDKSLKGVTLAKHNYSIYKGQKNVTMWVVEQEAKATALSNWPREIAAGKTREEAIDGFKAAMGGGALDKLAAVKFDLYSYRRGEKAGKFYIGKKVGKYYIDLKAFDSSAEARKYLSDNQAELERLLKQAKSIPNERRDTNEPRVGIDHRAGADVSPEQFSETFGFRGVQFGNYVEGERRQQDLNDAYDALMDMAGILGLPPKALSLNGELGLAFGARGKGAAGRQGGNVPSAHYESGTVVINLTKNRGAGSLAHEWWHAVDNYFSRARSQKEDFLTERSYERGEGVRPQMIAAFNELVQAINSTGLKMRSSALDKRRIKEYWGTGREMSARSFESYVIAKLKDQGAANDYLANIVSEDYWRASQALGIEENGNNYPYLEAAEIPAVRAAFDHFFNTVETKATDKGVAMFARKHIPDFIDVDGVQRPTRNSEGRPIYPTEEGIRNFWRWFGDSMAVDSKGRPVPLYHGTKSDVAQFDQEAGRAERAFFFTDDPRLASEYAGWKARAGGGNNVVPVYLRLQSPLIVDGSERNDYSFDKLIREAHQKGHDSLIVAGADDGPYPSAMRQFNNVYMAFEQTQIKSTIGNNGNFDHGDALINSARVSEKDRHRGEEPDEPLTVKQVKEITAKIALSWGGNAREIHVHATAADAPAWAGVTAGDGIQGFHDPVTGDVHLIVDALGDAKDVHRILAHEMAGHSAMEVIVEREPDGWYGIERRVTVLVNAGNKQAQKLYKEVKARGYDMDDRKTVVKEMLAVAVENHITDGPIGKILRQIRVAMRNFLRRHGINRILAAADIDAMVLKSLRFLEGSGDRARAMPEALYHSQLGDIDLETGKEGRFGASKFIADRPDIGANLVDLVLGAEVVSRDATVAILENKGIRFHVLNKGGRWVLTDVRPNFARDKIDSMAQREGSGDNLTDSKPLQPESEEFRKWFGASKAVDRSGNPLLVYHGSDRRLDTIEPGRDEPGAWFTSRLMTAAGYAKGMDGYVHKAYLKAVNPLIVTFDEEGGDLVAYSGSEPLGIDNNVDIVRYAQRKGYDSVHFPNGNFSEDDETWVVFDVGQIRIAQNPNPSRRTQGAGNAVSAVVKDGLTTQPGDQFDQEAGRAERAFFFTGDPRRGTREEAKAVGYEKAYRGVSKSDPFNATETVWLTTNKEVAESYAEEVFGYNDASVMEIWYDPKAVPTYDIRRTPWDVLEKLDPDEFGNPQKPGIYRNSDDSMLGASHTAIHIPKSAVMVVDDGGAQFSRQGAGDPRIQYSRGGITGNRGTFDPADARINFARAAPIQKSPRNAEGGAKDDISAAYPGAKMRDPDSEIGERSGRARLDSAIGESAKTMRQRASVTRIASSAGNVLADIFKRPGTFGPLARSIQTQYHKATKSPEFKAVWDRVHAMFLESARAMSRPASLAPSLLPKFDTSNFMDAIKAMATGKGHVPLKDIVAVSKALNAGTLYGGPSPTDGKVFTPDELKNGIDVGGETIKLTDSQILLYLEGRAAIDASLTEMAAAEAWSIAKQHADNDELRQAISENPHDAEQVLKKLIGDAKEKAEQELDDISDSASDEARKVLGDARLSPATRATRLRAIADRDESASAIADHAKAVADLDDSLKRIGEIFDKASTLKKAGYMPLMRFGRYRVSVVMKDESGSSVEYVSRYESAFEANRARRKLAEEFEPLGYRVSKVEPMNEEKWRMFKGVNPETVMLFAEESGVHAGHVMQTWYKEAVSNRSALRRMIRRKGYAGYSEDLPRVLASFITSNGKRAGYAYHLGDIQRMVNDDIPGDIQEEAQKLLESVTDPEQGMNVRGLMATWYLLGSAASSIVNMTQPIMMTIPWLSQHGKNGFSPGQASSALAGAYKQIMGKVRADTEGAIKRAEQDGTIDSNEVFHLYAESMKSMIPRFLGSGKMAYRARAFMTVWGAPFAMAEKLNRKATFIAAYQMAKDNGQSDDEAFDFAERAVIETQGVYAVYNRPNWARGPIGGAVMTFKQFSIAYIEMLSRMAKSGPAGRRAAVLALAILFCFAGAAGLPGEDDLLDMIDTSSQVFFGKARITRLEMRNALHDALGKELGGFVNNGISAFMPLDVSGRMGMGNLVPGTAVLKPSEPNKSSEVMEALGVAGSFGRSMIDGASLLLEGNVVGAARMAAPKGVGDIIKGVEMATTGEARDMRGRKIVDADSIDAAMQMIGFNPTSKAVANRSTYDIRELIGYHKRVESDIVGDMARGMIDHDQAKMAAARRRLKEWNEKNPGFPIRINFKQVVARAKQMKIEKADRLPKMAPKEIRRQVRDLAE